ncbi:MAG: methyltransferase [Lachnospiraceae bacterium]|nr:methyltransferase [Lachnospiraceae bacterium]
MEKVTEKIGNVLLDTSCYPGEDLYSDGAVEDKILELVRNYPEEEYNRVIAQEEDWAVMYHLAHERGNILSWYPFEPGAKVLEVGSGCGAVTESVTAQAASVTCIDLSKKRSTINALRNQKRENLKIRVGNFQDIEKKLEKDFDYATLIGVFEYGKGYIGGEKPYHEFLTTIMEHLRPGGKLLMAIENKFGLKYWAGCTEDHTGNFFEGLEGYQDTEGVRTFSKPELVQILEECGYHNYKFYYPYPDYKFPVTIYSDESLPKKGELTRNICNFDRKRLVLMDEEKVFDQLLADGLFPLYANSFFVEITKEDAGADGEKREQEKILYTKYSSGRAPQYAIQTRMIQGEKEEILFYKTAEYPRGQEHIQKIARAKEELETLWQEKGIFQVNQCSLKGEKIFFEYLEGITLEEELDRLLEQGEREQAREKIKEAVEKIRQAGDTQPFQITPEFQKVFDPELKTETLEQEPAVSVADIDLIFSNLWITKDGTWHVLDYEWTFFFPVPVEYLVYRALHYYIETSPKRKILNKDLSFYLSFGITDEKKDIYETMERNFQAYISGGYVSTGELYHRMGKKALTLGEILRESDRRRIQVYLNYGQGFSEKDSYFLDQGYEEKVTAQITVPREARALTIDPAISACVLRDLELCWINEEEEGGNLPVKYRINGFEMKKNSYLFDNSDPKIIIEEIPSKNWKIQISYHISLLEEETARLLMNQISTRGRIKRKVRRLVKG